jgi:hypothetical protein
LPARLPHLLARRYRPAGVIALAASILALTAPTAEAAGPPQIAATWSTEVAATSARLNVTINPEGLATTVRFEYLADAAYRANLAAVPPRDGFFGATPLPVGGALTGSSPQEASRAVSGLTPNITYRYRVIATNSAAPAGVSSAPNFFASEETAAIFHLLDDRGWELVSPIDKNGGAVQGPGANFGGDVLQAAAQGGAITYSSSSSFGADAQGAPAASQYLAARAEGGWSAQNATAPQRSGAEPAPGGGVPYRLFSADLSQALLFSGGDCLAPGVGCANPSPPLAGSGALSGYQNYYLRNAGGGYQALITTADAPALTLPAEAFEVSLAGATPDLAHVVLSTCAKLTADATEEPGCESGGPNLYEWSGGALRLLNRLGSDPLGSSDADLAAPAGAISTDGSRVYFTEGEDDFLYLREGEAGARLLSEGGVFQAASADGSVAYFTKGGELFRYDAQAGTSAQVATGVQGVLGTSADGSYLYYATAAGIFFWHAGTTSEVAPGPAAADPGSYPPPTGTARVSADGTHLAFLSKASLTGFDNLDSGTKQPDAELFLYTAPVADGGGTLTCASCNPTNERPIGSASVPGAISNGVGALVTQSYKPRALSADASRLFFDSEDSLVLQDTNNRPDVYEWEAPGAGTCGQGSAVDGGCVQLISSGRDGEASEFIDASAAGGDAFFLTAASLVPSDPGSYDLYDAREGGGFPIPPSPIPCNGDACQPLPSPPGDPTPGTLVPSPGNSPLHFPKTHPKKKHHHHKKKTKKHHKKHKRGGKR